MKNQNEILKELEEIKKSINDFKFKSKKYSTGHKYYKENLKKLKLKIRSFLIRLQKAYGKVKMPEEIHTLLNSFLRLEKPSKKDCEIFYDDLEVKIQDLELSVEEEDFLQERIYDLGSPFDFHNDVRDIIKKAEKEIFIIEPYIDEDLLEITLRGINNLINIKILANSHNPRGKFVKVSNKFISQHKGKFEARETDKIHDRGIFIDNKDGWVIGQSLKQGGKKPTYIIKLKDSKKLEAIYNKIFLKSKKIK